MVTNALPADVAEFRQEAMVEEVDGTLYLTLHGENDNVRNSQFKRPFDFRAVGTLDDGDPHYV